MKNKARAKLAHGSPLFTVRLWLEKLGDGQTEWRGRVQHVLSGERCYFRDWTTRVEGVMAMLERLEGSESVKAG